METRSRINKISLSPDARFDDDFDREDDDGLDNWSAPYTDEYSDDGQKAENCDSDFMDDCEDDVSELPTDEPCGEDDFEEESAYEKISPEELKALFNDLHSESSWTREKAGIRIEEQFKRLIKGIAYKNFPSYMQNKAQNHEEDLIASGWLGFYSCVDEYDPSRGAPSTFFYRPVLHEMSEYVNRFLHKATSYNIGVRKRIAAAEKALIAKGNKKPSIMDLAFEAGMKPSNVRRALEAAKYADTKSIDSMAREPGERSRRGLGEQAHGDYDQAYLSRQDMYDPFTALVRKEDSKVLDEALATLTDNQEDVIRRLYGYGREQQNYSTIFHETGITTNRIKALETQAKNRLRMNRNLRINWKSSKSMEIKDELDFEPICITPDSTAQSIMETLCAMEFDEL